MGEFLQLEESRRFYTSKFLRAGTTIITTDSGDVSTPHKDLAEQSGIANKIAEIRATDPSQVDGGQYSREGHSVRIHRDSSDFKLPVKGSGAREITAKLFQLKSPSSTVIVDEHFEWPK